MSFNRGVFVSAWSLTAFSICVCQGATAYLTPVADATLMEAFPTNNFGGNEYFNSGTTQNYTTNRGLLKFDPAAAIGCNAKVTFVSLTLEVVGNPVDGDNPSVFVLHRMFRDWGEGTKAGHPPQQPWLGQPAENDETTWYHRFAQTSNTWTIPGAQQGVDYAAQQSGDTFVYGINFSPYVFDSTSNLIADVQFWLEHPAQNFGWMLRTLAETNNFTARRFASREDIYRAPLLIVDYFQPRIQATCITNNTLTLTFTAEAAYSYSVEFSHLTPGAAWQTLTNLPLASNSTVWIVSDPLTEAPRYYRLRVE